MFQIPRVTKTTRNDDNQMIEFKIQIKDFYLSYLLVKVDAKNKIEDIFQEIRKYEPSINQNEFTAVEYLMGDFDDTDNDRMRELNLKMPLEMLKTHTIVLKKKSFYDEIVQEK